MAHITEEEMNGKSESEQLKFYKKQFRYQHCSCGCGRELGTGKSWVLLDGEAFQVDCYEKIRQAERQMIKNNIEQLTELLEKEKEKLENFK